jgi:DNA-binding NarL/FixJ family response regulator
MSNIGISVLSDDRLFCESILRVLDDDPRLTAGNRDMPGSGDGESERQELTILDAGMPDVLQRCCTLAGEADIAVILVRAPDDDAWAEAALKAGALGIITKTSDLDELARAIHVVLEGGIWAKRRWLNASVRSLAASRSRPAAALQIGALLSDREREVSYHAALGVCNKQIADRLRISEATVKAHLTRVFYKLGISGRGELAAAYHGLLPELHPRRLTTSA